MKQWEIAEIVSEVDRDGTGKCGWMVVGGHGSEQGDFLPNGQWPNDTTPI